ncbi:GMC oxidoreductase [Sorangium sp. So ce131]|uniref:GMC oxidoreductase n=1 Tax=Sorangium sp. So ce131 TaxID=3133282 RepID=UPI003F5F7B6A
MCPLTDVHASPSAFGALLQRLRAEARSQVDDPGRRRDPLDPIQRGGRGRARPNDPGAVVDAGGAVRGVDGLHVVGASIMPDIISAPTNVTTIMIAEAISRKL